MPDIQIVCIMSAALLVAEHYFPWARILRRELPRPAAYIIGALAILVPQAYLSAYRNLTMQDLLLPWILGGSAVLICYIIDALLDGRDNGKLANKFEGIALDANDEQR